jgi:hypothetical protein
VPILALASLGLIIASTLFLDWFVFESNLETAGVGLHAIGNAGRGLFPLAAKVTLWSSLAFAGLVGLQAAQRIVSDGANEGLSKFGYGMGLVVLILAGATGYVLGPDAGEYRVVSMGFSFSIDRTFAPALLMIGDLAGMFTLYYAIVYDTGSTTILTTPLATARALPRSIIPPHSQPLPTRPTSQPLSVKPTSPRLQPKPKTQPPVASQPLPAKSDLIPKFPRAQTQPIPLRGKIKYVALAGEVTRGGIDARREDGSSLLVMWRDVVGVVARRLPAVLEGETFVDVVSSAGSTLRIMPWTRLSGDPIAGEGELRARAFIQLVVARCPTAKLDPATRTFVETEGQAAQLPDVETLGVHDEKLA